MEVDGFSIPDDYPRRYFKKIIARRFYEANNLNYKQGKLDYGIEDLIDYLNDNGYKTTHSCTGHGIKDGYISFYILKGRFPRKDRLCLGEICKKFGIEDITFGEADSFVQEQTNYAYVRFPRDDRFIKPRYYRKRYRKGAR